MTTVVGYKGGTIRGKVRLNSVYIINGVNFCSVCCWLLLSCRPCLSGFSVLIASEVICSGSLLVAAGFGETAVAAVVVFMDFVSVRPAVTAVVRAFFAFGTCRWVALTS